MTYPATTYAEGVELTITSGNQLHEIINGLATEEINTESGMVPSVRKALADSMLFKPAIAWAEGSVESDPFQTRLYGEGIYWAPAASNETPISMGTNPDIDGNWFLAPVTGGESISRNTNLLSNHNFITQSPDDITHPSVTPTDYVSGTQVFSSVFVGDDIVGLTYIDGRVSWTSGTLYFSVPNSGALEYVEQTDFVASVADFDGKPRTRGVSYALVGDEYLVTVGVDALEDESANETLLGSVKFEQGSVATGHEVGALSVGNLSDYTDVVFKSSGSSSAVAEMVNLFSLNPSAYAVGSVLAAGGVRFKYEDSTGTITANNFAAMSDVIVQAFGAGESSTPSENRIAYEEAVAYCLEKGVKLTSLAGEIHTVDGTVDIRRLRNVDLLSQINGNGEFVTVLMGGYSTETQQYYTQKIYKANRGGSLPAVRISGSNKNTIIIGEASIIELYADTDSSKSGQDEYCAYNKIYINSCTSLVINSNPNTDGSVVQWINENQFYLSFIIDFTIIDNGYQHNGNQFFGGNFEASSSFIDMQTGVANTFWNVRGENSLSVTFGSNSANNTVLTDWIESPNNPTSGATVTNNGLNNCVKNTADLYNDRILMCGFNGSTLLSSSGNTNILGVNAGLNIDSTLNTVTASANQLIYTSQLIQISAGNQYFNVITEDKLSGGIRMKIDAYDSSMNLITSTGDDVFYPGATNEDAGFGENSTTITNSLGQRRIHIKNTSAKWIILTVNASSAGCSFRRFEFSAITSSVYGKYELMTSAMIGNIS